MTRHPFRSASHLPGVLGGLASACLLSCEARALDFSGHQLVYEETYDGESSFPTSPEIDLQGFGGMTGGSSPNGSAAPTLAGGSARVDVALVLPSDDPVQFTQTVPTAIGAGTLGLRGGFAGVVRDPDGYTVLGYSATYSSSDRIISASVHLTSLGANLEVRITDISSSFVANSGVSLAAGDAALIDAGGALTFDFEIDKATSTGTASVQVAGGGAYTTPVLALSGLDGGAPVDAVWQLGGVSPGFSQPTHVDMTDFALYAGPHFGAELREGELSAGAASALQNVSGTLRLEQPKLGLDFVPEPLATRQLAAGIALLALLWVQRRRIASSVTRGRSSPIHVRSTH